jgi:hypothetical protein
LRKDKFKDLDIDPCRVWYLLGYTESDKPPPIIEKAIRQAMEIGLTLLEPAACYDIFDIRRVTPSSVEVCDVRFDSEDLAFRFRQAEEMAIFVCTIGSCLEDRVEKFTSGSSATLGFALDMFGTAAVETAAFKTRETIQDDVIAQGKRATTNSYCIGSSCTAYADCGGVVVYWWSPGFGDQKTQDQRKLFGLLDGTQIGVQLNESCMMIPRKSYACLLPIGRQQAKPAYKCEEGSTNWIRQGSLIKQIRPLRQQ